MSMFIITRTTQYVVILADNLAHKDFAVGNKAPLPAPKLTHVAPCVFATHAGTWQPAFEILSNFREFLLSSPNLRTFDEITAYLEKEGNKCFEKYCKLWKRDAKSFDLKIPIILTGSYRHKEDIAQNICSTILIFETANSFKPTRSHGGWFAVDTEVSTILSNLMNITVIKNLMNASPLSMASVLKALHSFVSNISVYVSSNCNIVIIGEDDEHSLIEGHMISLPMKALIQG